MSKLGAIAMLATIGASMTSFAAAQECAGEFGDDSQCHGMDDNMKKMCCEGLECQKKDDWYGQCRPIGMDIPDGWDGTILNYSGDGSGGTTDDMEETTDEMEETTDGTEVDPVDTVAAAPGIAAAFMGIIGKDYIPSTDPMNLVMVEDIAGASKVVASQKECEEFCSATEGCNAASYYIELVGDKNCWLKTMEDTCEVPSDAITDPNATLLLMFDDECVGDATGALSPMGVDAMAPGAVAAAPEAVEVATRDADLDITTTTDAADDTTTDPTSDVTTDGTTEATTGTTSDDATVETNPASSAGSMRSAAIAVAVVGAAAFL